jgi:hypothetical protein
VDLEQDRLDVTYDTKRLTPEQLLEVVRKQGFQGTIRPGAPPDTPREGGGN